MFNKIIWANDLCLIHISNDEDESYEQRLSLFWFLLTGNKPIVVKRNAELFVGTRPEYRNTVA